MRSIFEIMISPDHVLCDIPRILENCSEPKLFPIFWNLKQYILYVPKFRKIRGILFKIGGKHDAGRGIICSKNVEDSFIFYLFP